VAPAVSAPLDCEPLRAMLPDQAPDALHAVAWAVDQLSVELPPLATVLGLADRLMVGAGVGVVTATVTDWLALPPAPEQLST
jgi:hypothetical protein